MTLKQSKCWGTQCGTVDSYGLGGLDSNPLSHKTSLGDVELVKPLLKYFTYLETPLGSLEIQPDGMKRYYTKTTYMLPKCTPSVVASEMILDSTVRHGLV